MPDHRTALRNLTATCLARLPTLAVRVPRITPSDRRLTVATPQDEHNSRARHDAQALSQALRLQNPTHDSYGFHTTFACPTAHRPPPCPTTAPPCGT